MLRSSGLAGVALGLAATLLAAGSGWAREPGPKLDVVYDCAFPSFLGGDYEQGGIVFTSSSRYKYGTKVKRKELAGRISRGRYEVKGKTFDLPAITFLTGPKILRPDREDEQRSFFDPAKPYYVGIWAENATDLPWDCYRAGSRQWRQRERDQREDG